jgi:hypothetical protein
MMASGGSGRGSRSGRGGRRRPRGSRSASQGGQKKGGAVVPQAPRKGKAFSTPYQVPETGAVDPFDLFCACFLGLMPDGTYRNAGLGEVAKRFRRSPGELKQMLRGYGMDTESLQDVDFDVSLAKLDIQVAPEGIDRRELARGLFEEFVDVHPTLQEGAPHGNGVSPEGNGSAPEPAPKSAPKSAPKPSRQPAAGRRHGRGQAATPEPVREAPAPEGDDTAPEEPEAAPAAGDAETAPAEDAPTAVVTPEAPDEAEEALVTADVAGEKGGSGAPAEARRAERSGDRGQDRSADRSADRPVRQIRRSPVRRGGGRG